MSLSTSEPDIVNKDIQKSIEALQELGAAEQAAGRLDYFVSHHASLIIALLEELREKRLSGNGGGTSKGQNHRLLVEGYSEDNMKAAFSEAMSKAMSHFSEHHDVSIQVAGCVKLPKGGYRVTLEMHITPIKHSLRKKPLGLDVELKRAHKLDNKSRQKTHEESLQHMVHDHFLHHTGGQIPSVPDYMLININCAEALEMMIEQDFFHAGHESHDIKKTHKLETPQMMLRIHKPKPKTEPED